MSKLLKIFMALTLAITTSCGNQDNKTVEGGVDQDMVLVNQVRQFENEEGEQMVEGTLGVIVGAETNEDLEEATKNGEILALNMDELRLNGYNFEAVDAPESDELQQVVSPWAVAAGVVFWGLTNLFAYKGGKKEGYKNGYTHGYWQASAQNRPVEHVHTYQYRPPAPAPVPAPKKVVKKTTVTTTTTTIYKVVPKPPAPIVVQPVPVVDCYYYY